VRTVIVTGAGGQLGSAAVAAFRGAGWRVVPVDHRALDVGDRDAVLQAILHVRPDAVLNAAAWTAVDACEGDPDEAFRVNALAVRHLAEGCRRAGAHLCQVSTDYVFSGTLAGTDRRPYTEWDETGPLSVYGWSKLAGEQEAGDEATVVRTAWLAGATGPNIVRTVLGLAADPDRRLAFVDDQWGSPTVVEDLAGMIVRLVSERRPGVHHVTNQGAATWWTLARHVLAAAGHDPDRVRAIGTAELEPPRPARRPPFAVLDNAVLRLQGMALLRPWEEAISELVHRHEAGGPAEDLAGDLAAR